MSKKDYKVIASDGTKNVKLQLVDDKFGGVLIRMSLGKSSQNPPLYQLSLKEAMALSEALEDLVFKQRILDYKKGEENE